MTMRLLQFHKLMRPPPCPHMYVHNCPPTHAQHAHSRAYGLRHLPSCLSESQSSTHTLLLAPHNLRCHLPIGIQSQLSHQGLGLCVPLSTNPFSPTVIIMFSWSATFLQRSPCLSTHTQCYCTFHSQSSTHAPCPRRLPAPSIMLQVHLGYESTQVTRDLSELASKASTKTGWISWIRGRHGLMS